MPAEATVVNDLQDGVPIRGLAEWDGRYSLGGIWVAHRDVSEPARVRITSVATGTSVTGALFARADGSAPETIQISSDAAAALSISANTPVELVVTPVLRDAPEQTSIFGNQTD